VATDVTVFEPTEI